MVSRNAQLARIRLFDVYSLTARGCMRWLGAAGRTNALPANFFYAMNFDLVHAFARSIASLILLRYAGSESACRSLHQSGPPLTARIALKALDQSLFHFVLGRLARYRPHKEPGTK
jgi:hypothetical protein